MKTKKTVLFANEEIVITQIVSVKAYERDYKNYVEVKTATREYIEEFSDENCSGTLRRSISTDFLFGGSSSERESNLKKFELAQQTLLEKTKKRYDEMLNLL